jgi:hypothetical protein
LCKGEIYGKVDLSPQTETDRKGSNNRGNDRRDRGGRDRRDRRRNNA